MKKIIFPVIVGLFLLSTPILKDKDGDYSQYRSILTDICGITDGNAVMVGIQATDYWAGAGLRGKDSHVYMVLHNRYDEDDALVSASTDAAASVEIHLNQSIPDSSTDMANLIILPAKRIVEFAPGGPHLILINLKQDLKAGNEVTITLHFQQHEDLIITLPIKNW